jgi:hypothetical protein
MYTLSGVFIIIEPSALSGNRRTSSAMSGIERELAEIAGVLRIAIAYPSLITCDLVYWAWK